MFVQKKNIQHIQWQIIHLRLLSQGIDCFDDHENIILIPVLFLLS